MRYLFEKLTNYQNDNERYKLLPIIINPDVVSNFRSGAKERGYRDWGSALNQFAVFFLW